MKTIRNILTAFIAAGAPGVALLAFLGHVPADLALAALTAVGLVAFAIYDFSRNTASLTVRSAVIRPPLRAVTAPAVRVMRKAA